MRLEAKTCLSRYHKGNRQILNHVSVSADRVIVWGLQHPVVLARLRSVKYWPVMNSQMKARFYWMESHFRNIKVTVRSAVDLAASQEAVNPRRKMKPFWKKVVCWMNA